MTRCKQMDRQTYKSTDKQIIKWMNRCKKIEKHVVGKKDRQTDETNA